MNSETWKGMAIGFAAGLLVPMVFPVVARGARPTVNAAIRAGIEAWERGRETLAELGEYADDMMAEARARHNGGAPMSATGTGEAASG